MNTKTTLPSGLTFIVLEDTNQNGKIPTKGKPVKVHYTGWLYDTQAQDNKGSQFDSSVKRGQPFSFVLGVGQVIQGWDEGVALMHVGQKVRLVIPANLGYGSRSIPGAIPANSTLIFDVELLDC